MLNMKMRYLSGECIFLEHTGTLESSEHSSLEVDNIGIDRTQCFFIKSRYYLQFTDVFADGVERHYPVSYREQYRYMAAS